MSRTIKTMPPAVRALDQRSLREYHNHDRGPCDLPEHPTLASVGWGDWQRNCHWDYSHGFYYTNSFCGCRSCTDYWGRKWERRKDRHIAKREARQVMKYGESS